MLDKKEYCQIFEKYAQDTWKSNFSWCSTITLDGIIAVNEILKRDSLNNVLLKCVEKYDIYHCAISYIVRNYSDDALEFVQRFLRLKHSAGTEWGKKYLDFVFSITNQYRNGDPFIDLFLNLHPDILPQADNFEFKPILKKFYSDEIKEPGPVPPCFISFWETFVYTQTEKVELYFLTR
jgi:hypothetical protein